MITDDVYGNVVPATIVLPTSADVTGRAGTIYIRDGKLRFTPTDGGAEETVTSA